MKICFLGGGNMAAALIGGLRDKGAAGGDITVIEPTAERREALRNQFGVRSVPPDEAASVAAADVLVLAVKPQQMREACAPLVGHLGASVVVSIAAGLPLSLIGEWLGGHAQLVRSMPNTPALVGAGITGLYALPAVDAAGRGRAAAVMAAVGKVVWVDDEAQMDAVTAISGSGPAYVFLFIEALVEAAESMGFSPEVARQLAVQTALGGAQLAAASDESVATLRERVTSKGGTTEAALAVMTGQHVREGLVAGAQAALSRGRELGRQLAGKD